MTVTAGTRTPQVDAVDLVGRFLERTGEVDVHRRVDGFLRRDFEGDAARDAVAQSVAVEEVALLDRITDPWGRARAAQLVLDATHTRIGVERVRRDQALRALLRAYAKELAAYEVHRSRARYRAAMRSEWKIDQAAALGRVSVTLCRKILVEVVDGGLTADRAETQTAEAGRYIVDLSILRDRVREEVRDRSVRRLLRSEANIAVARTLGLTTARITQIGATHTGEI